jgi:hypothetical protein
MPSPHEAPSDRLRRSLAGSAPQPFPAVRGSQDAAREIERSFDEGPRIASIVDLLLESSELSGATEIEASPFGSVVTGSYLLRGSGLPTALPVDHRLVLARGGRFGLRRYERAFTQSRL